MSTLYLTEAYAMVRRDSEDCLLVQIPERKGKDWCAACGCAERAYSVD
jgi:hypothetical protein